MPEKTIERRSNYQKFLTIPTRWMDNDVYGHVNNVIYYSYFDTVINEYLMREGGLDIAGSEVIGVCAESGCSYRESFAFPEVIEAGLRAGHLGRRSVRYEVGLFRAGKDEAAATGHFVHVFVDRASMRPTEPPPTLRDALSALLVAAPADG